MAQWSEPFLHTREDPCSDPQKPTKKYGVCAVTYLEFKETEDLQSKLPGKTSHIGKLWICLGDSASGTRVEKAVRDNS